MSWRSGALVAVWFVGALVFGGAAQAGAVQVISDRAEFVGDFTVIDFETRGDGTPIVLNPGGQLNLNANEFLSLGVQITSSTSWFAQPRILNTSPSAQLHAGQMIAGSPPNALFDGSFLSLLHFAFARPVNAVGIAVFDVINAGDVTLDIYDFLSRPIASITFGGSLIDGVIPGADYGMADDLAYGFIGIYSPDVMIGSATLRKDITLFDDLHFGMIPEPGSLMTLALLAVAGWSARRGARRGVSPSLRSRPVAPVGIAVILGAAGAAQAGAVQVISDRAQFVGDFTVIDFETRGDGTPIVLDPGNVFHLNPAEYASAGVTIDSSGLGFPPFVGTSASSAFSHAAHQLAGSSPNFLGHISLDNAFRLDFVVPVNAIGLATITNVNAGPVLLSAFDNAGRSIGIVAFDGHLVDGIVDGDVFGSEDDLAYGFFGLYSPDSLIYSVTVYKDRAGFDDLHFGIIPEPGALLTLALLTVAGWSARRGARRGVSPSLRSRPAARVCRAVIEFRDASTPAGSN